MRVDARGGDAVGAKAWLLVATLVVPGLWGAVLPPLLVRIWPRRGAGPPTVPPPLPDYEI
jgi:hypothetical protein